MLSSVLHKYVRTSIRRPTLFFPAQTTETEISTETLRAQLDITPKRFAEGNVVAIRLSFTP